jgi:aspartate-semialdehyde dehydrogenase
MDRFNLAVIGATGAVGKIFLSILEERNFPLNKLRLCASERSLGKKIKFANEDHYIEPVTNELLSDCDFVFISASSEVSLDIAPRAAKLGSIAIDDSSAFRMNKTVPLVVPEVNSKDLDQHKGIVSIPNCSTTPLTMVLHELGKLAKINRVIVDTFQSVSGAGAGAVFELDSQNHAMYENSEIQASIHPHRIAFNVIPQIDDFTESGYTNEEMKMINETKKILHRPDLNISATCVRVPVKIGHSEAVHIEFEQNIDIESACSALSNAPGITLLDDTEKNHYPMPINCEHKDDVMVGRLRKDVSLPNGMVLWLSCDNLRKGAALNAIQIAESIIEKRLI